MNLMWKDLLRTIRYSIGRFLAIAIICALGVGFFAGLQMTSGDMKKAITDFFNQTNMMDIRVFSTLGLEQQNIDSFKNIEGVKDVIPAYETDIVTYFANDQIVVRLHSLPDCAINNPNNEVPYINEQILVEGEMPKNADECVLSADIPSVNLPQIGDYIEIKECSSNIDTTLTVKKLKVTGFVRSSYYVGIVQMGTSFLGSGIINDFAYVPESTFSVDYPYSEAFITVDGSCNYITGSDDYQNHINEVLDKIAEILPSQAELRVNSLKTTQQQKLDDSKKDFLDKKESSIAELNSNENKLEEALKTLQDSKKQIDEGQKQIEEGFAELYASKNTIISQIDEGISYSEKKLKTIEQLSKENNQIIQNINDNYNKIATKSDIGNGFDNLIESLNNSQSFNNQTIEFLSSMPTVPQDFIYMLNACSSADAKMAQATQTIYDIYKVAPLTIDVLLPEFNNAFKEYKKVEETKSSSFLALISESQKAINELYVNRNNAIANFNEKESELFQKKNELEAGNSTYLSGTDSYNNYRNQFLDAKSQAYSQLGIAEQQLINVQSEIDNIKRAEFYAMDRTKNPGAINFNNDANRIASIANVFPLIFFFVALLVALTSMTRMVEEERIIIGTYKALGFSVFQIAKKYLAYAFIASFIGSVVGILVLAQFLPWVIMFAYSIIYKLPIPFPMPYDFFIAFISIMGGVGLTLIVTLLVVKKSLKATPAILMVPSAPKAGKRVLLERISPIWNMINFYGKVSIRNMFLYKKRLFMTLIGIAGCFALLLTGFGLHDSISDIMNNQFDEISFDNLRISFIEDPSQSNLDSVADEYDKFNAQGSYVLTDEKNYICQPEGHPNQTVIVVCPNDVNKFQELKLIRDRVTHQEFDLNDDGAYISEKIAKLLNVDVGDEISLHNQDISGNAGPYVKNVTISGIFENYIAHYIYLNENAYRKYFGDNINYKNLMCACDIADEDKQSFLNNINNIENVKTAYFNDENRETYNKMLVSVNLVVVILILAAAILAFVVLYNLININICERTREIATLKVLGCYRNEIYGYIHRETFVLSILGCFIGIILGIIMEDFVIQSSEVDYVMFGRNIYWWSILLSGVITLIFTLLVAIFMRKKLFSISMVESLKSVE